VAATLALWRREQGQTRPAQAANDSRLDARQQPLAGNANAREKEIDHSGKMFPKRYPSAAKR